MIPSDKPPIETFKMPKEWTYRGEGNCNIVISLPKHRKILRIRKTEKPRTILGWLLVLISDFLHWYYGKGFRDETRDLNFYSKIMRPLLGSKYTSEAKQVVLTRKQVHIFKEQLSRIRPDFRQNKTLQYGRASIFDDFAFLPAEYDNIKFVDNTFSVEIKPKQGWRPLKEQILPQCFFCMNQFLKMENKQIKTITKYCPEELFSGDKNRMKTALKHLFEVPQNNFRIFKNGSLCYDEKNRNTKILKEIFQSQDSEEILNEALCEFLQNCLVTNLTNKSNTGCCAEDISNSNIKNVNANSGSENRLPKGSVLERILSIQMLDIEGSHSTYKKLSKNSTWDDWSFVDKLLETVDSCEKICVKCSILRASNKYENELLFVPYLISAIAKDCSLMVTFRKVIEKSCENLNIRNIFKTNYGYFLVNIGVFDLYPKPLSTIHKHYKRNKDILKAFKNGNLGKKNANLIIS